MRHRLSVPALIIAALYAAALVTTAVLALTTGDVAPLWRLTVFGDVQELVEATPANVATMLLIGLPWTCALWLGLRGPRVGQPPELTVQEQRLRLALYAAAATWLIHPLAQGWPWWAVVLDSVLMLAVVVLIRPVLGDSLEYASWSVVAGVLAFGGGAVVAVSDEFALGLSGGAGLALLLAQLVWMVLVLRAQRWDGRWRFVTYLYGITSLVLPMLVLAAGWLIVEAGSLLYSLSAAAGVLMAIWLVDTANDLADPRNRKTVAPAAP
ncbi:unnamed protein product [[Actinomadura] parvosata subsp. kistnae]|uniref:DUF998 domain-containing protein n=1 Tax=[Actinomadura] parvosata subsp. kistnae TaxID=1909395 RepID=A0A1U9ZTJ7_9ACTN|nr:hypothetical protein [Nonomuraea sp. ATCC 55076]AQZ61276.1 hypothetical protein BKM31_07055 [Nonomuraea sp. ATCC 55076]SPL97922.1 unnamed protein product [Actinomadura parvosata subsp. kistnae]